MRVLALIAVAAAHVIAIYFLGLAVRMNRENPLREAASMIVFFMEDRQETTPVDPIPHLAESATRSRMDRSREKSPRAETPISPSNPRSNAITDWYAEAEAAADSVVRREREKAALRSFTHKFAPSPEKSKPGVFGSEQMNRRAGTVESGYEGERHWVSDNCYFEFDRKPPRVTFAGDIRLKTATCKPPPTGGGDRMFEHLAPGYLRKSDENRDD